MQEQGSMLSMSQRSVNKTRFTITKSELVLLSVVLAIYYIQRYRLTVSCFNSSSKHKHWHHLSLMLALFFLSDQNIVIAVTINFTVNWFFVDRSCISNLDRVWSNKLVFKQKLDSRNEKWLNFCRMLNECFCFSLSSFFFMSEILPLFLTWRSIFPCVFSWQQA